MLQNEERKMQKKIDETRNRADEINTVKQRNEEKYQLVGMLMAETGLT
jgi:hypothetical protein